MFDGSQIAKDRKTAILDPPFSIFDPANVRATYSNKSYFGCKLTLNIGRSLAGEELAYSRVVAVIAQILRLANGHDTLHLVI